MTFLQTVFGKGWANFLVTEPKDDNWGYGTGKMFILALMLGCLFYIISLGYSPTPRWIDMVALSLSFVILLGSFLFADYESNHENSRGAGFILFGSQFNFLTQVVVGLVVTIGLIVFLGASYCSTPRYVAEGYCIQVNGQQQFVLPSQASFFKAELAEPFYSILLAPATEELVFRNILFYSLLTILTSYFAFFRNMKANYPIMLFLILAITSSTLFGFWHFERAHASCPEGDSVCLFDRLWVSNIYGLVWIAGNQITGGFGFSLAGHIWNNFTGTPVSLPNFVMYILIPFVVLVYVGTMIMGFFKKKR